jgi:type II secretory pathway component GspD/PulD (secretin)
MKTILIAILLASLANSAITLAADPPPAAGKAEADITTNQPVVVVATNAPPETVATEVNGNETNLLRMNFRGASLEMVLNYLSEAAGFIINVKPGVSVRGKVDVWSNDPLTRTEALNLVDSVLNQNGLAAIHNGRTLTIVNRDEAKTQDVPVVSESNPEKIPRTDKIVTQIIPVRFVEVATLLKDLTPLVSLQTTMTANEAGNAIVITDTQANIRKVAEIIHAIDMGAEDFTEVRVFHLVNSDPTEISELLSTLFPDDSRQGQGNAQSPFAANPFLRRFGGFGGGGGPGGGGRGGGGNASTSNNQNQRIKKRNRVVAVADQRTASVIVSSSKDLMDQIAEVITSLDENPKGRQTVRVFRLENADPQEALPVLQDIFQRNTSQNNRNGNNSQNSPLLNRSTTQNQQNNSNNRSTMAPNARGGGGQTPSFQ